MKTNIISMSSRQFLGPYIYVTNPRWNFDWPFYLGVALTVALPQVVFGFYFGSYAFLALGACEMLGTGVGLSNYRRPPAPMPSCAPPSLMQTSADQESRLKRAA